jgi:hypothetical protein
MRRRWPDAGLLCLGLLLWGYLALAQGTPASFVLIWQHQQDASSPAVSFALQRCLQSGSTCNFTDLAGASALPYTTPTWTDSTITANVSYCYRVAAANQYGRSPYSSTFCAQLGSPPANAPTGLQIHIIPATP